MNIYCLKMKTFLIYFDIYFVMRDFLISIKYIKYMYFCIIN